MEKKIVVITKNGFMTSKDPKDVVSSDDVLFEGTEQECNDFIHSK